jgi:hypothetical protein
MKLPKLLFVAVFLCGAQAAATEESFQGTVQRGAAAQPSQYSFADLYRLTVPGPAAAAFPAGFSMVPAADAPIRVATAPAHAQFSIAEVKEPELWLLLLAGIALAAWVARRRLGYGF